MTAAAVGQVQNSNIAVSDMEHFPMLKTREVNQNAFTALAAALWVSAYENCRVVAVTAEKKVATVDRLSRLAAPCFCANRIVGTPIKLV